jgi:two-component system CheB/CheR fusion protein
MIFFLLLYTSLKPTSMSIKPSHQEDKTVATDNFLIVGIGASAGGVQALRTFFENVPEDSGIAYVVILHLSPSYDSHLAEVLAQVTTIPVTKVTERITVRPDHIYVVPPNQHLTIADDAIEVSPNTSIEERRAPVDIFFRTLADAHGPRAISVILSGTGANGSMGMKRIKEQGGAAFVQNPQEAQYNEMPRNSIETELVDDVLPVAEIPKQILIYKNRFSAVRIVDDGDERPEDQQQALREIFTQIRTRTGHDFSNYKRPTLLRRIERRVNMRNLPNLTSYAVYLRESPDEIVALLKDLLISVTNFFRDAKPFQTLETEVLPAILKDKGAEDRVRIWVAGCATGEEAYSLAMLLAELTLGVIDGPKIQIFATDIDDAALAVAREGYYTLNDAADVLPERLRRFFAKEGDGYRVRREIREMILFANHNVLKDPPFSRLNLIACRNVLIYLNNTAQERVMEIFHFALNPGGFLFLGTSESTDGANDLYATFNRESHIFQARQVPARNVPVPDSTPGSRFNPIDSLQQSQVKEAHLKERITFGELHHRLLEEYAPPSVVVNEDHEIVHMSEKVGKYFELSGGEPTQNLLKLIRPELRLDLRAALYQAVQQQSAIEVRDLQMSVNGQVQAVNMLVRPALNGGDTAKGFILVIFEERTPENGKQPTKRLSDEPLAKQLEAELVRLKGQLRSSVEQHEFQSEELKASNEELQAMNEELRSAAEELETSKEELQSINEELRTVNQELKVKVDEISLSSNNLLNLMNSADVGTIFLDRDFQIKLFTPAIRQIFNLIDSDFGRPITDITNKIQYDGLLKDAETVLEKLTVIDREVTTTDNRLFAMRLLPYRTAEDRISGIVITFFDITKRRNAEEALRRSEEHLRLIIESAKDYAIFTLDTGRHIVSWSKGAEAMMGYREAEVIGQSGDIIFTPEDRSNNAPEKETDKAVRHGYAINERWHMRKSGERFWGSGTVSPLRDRGGKLLGYVKIMRDLTEARRVEEAKFFLASIVESSQDAIFTVNFNNEITSWNKSAEEMYGHQAAAVIGKVITEVELPGDLKALFERKQTVEQLNTAAMVNPIAMNKDGEERNLEVTLSQVKNAKGKVIGVSTISRDVTARKRAEEDLRRSEDRYRSLTMELSRKVEERTQELVRSNEDLLQFAHVASHDLREPIRKIMVFTNRISEEFGVDIPEKGKIYLEKIGHATARMVSMIEGVLNYSSNILEASLETVDLNNIIQQIENDLELLISSKAAVITRNDLPSIDANAVLIYQLFYNLINNSLKFSKSDVPPRINVWHTYEKRGDLDYLKIMVSDNGIGFEMDFKDNVFEIFSRLNPKDEYEGTGLGLALCKKIVNRYNGSIFAVGRVNEGATFTILLPVVKVHPHK